MKVLVDKRTCFVGEPVLATFKLYSRLQSKSDIVKNPGFYGFTVYDMVNLADKQVATEMVKGKNFDVHTIRKVQLYPLQAGVFTIDEMGIKNKIEFSRSVVNKKTEQEVIEGVLVQKDCFGCTSQDKAANTEEFESSMSTEPVVINVKPMPVKNKPASFYGATGQFSISANAVNNKLSKEEGDILEITISGKGNFVQMNEPVVQWPAGVEGFEPSVKEVLDKSTSPLTGSRTYRYAFASAIPGTYTIPPVSFSFFNTDSGNYKTITTVASQVSIDNSRRKNAIVSGKKELKKTKNTNYWLIGGAVVLLFSGLFWFIRRKKINTAQPIQSTEKKTDSISVNAILIPASLLIQVDDKIFYSSLRQSMWNWLRFHFNFSGSTMSKENSIAKLKERGVPEELINEIKNILQQCETGMFTNVELEDDKQILLNKTEKLLEQLNKSLL
jgi:hypothetical protein